MGKKHFPYYKNIQSYGNFPNPNSYNVPKSQKPPSPFNPQSRYIPYQGSVEAPPGDKTNSRPTDYYYPPGLKSSSEALPYSLNPPHKDYTEQAYRRENPYQYKYRASQYDPNRRMERENRYENDPREEQLENDPNQREQDPRNPYEMVQNPQSKYDPSALRSTEHMETALHEGAEPRLAKESPQQPKIAWQKEEPIQHPRNSEAYREEQLSQEIARLQEELRRKEERLYHIRESPAKGSSVYTKINKSLFDKMQMDEQRKERSTVLDHQLQEKEMFKQIEQQEKDYELAERLEDLKRIKEEEMLARNEQVQRAQEYRESLKVQEQLKRAINHEEVEEQDETPQIEFKPHTHHIGRFTKKAPKTITFDPINCVVRDTSAYVTGDYQPINRDKTNPVLSVYHNQYKIPPEYSKFPAFQQPVYSKAHPKVMPSFPITGTNFRMKNSQEMPKSRQRSEPKFRGYGSMLMKPEYRA